MKRGMNTVLPGSGSIIDFDEGLYNISEGEYASGLINIGFGVLELATLGVFGVAKAVAKDAGVVATEATKAATSEATEEVAKEAFKALNNELSEGMVECIV